VAVLPVPSLSPQTANRLLDALPDADRAGLVETGWTRRMDAGDVLLRDGDRIRNVWFPITAVVSLLTTLDDGTAVETATVGREGAVGAVVFLGDDRLRNGRAVVQLAGDLIGVPVDTFRTVLARSDTLRSVMTDYTRALVFQLSQSVACNAAHSVQERLARWLLQTTDRVARSEVELTQQFLSEIVHARRASVTDALAALEDAGALMRGRGRITVHRRRALEDAACECYAAVRDAYAQVTGA
jgi:CRP-like cAMP-binding protein